MGQKWQGVSYLLKLAVPCLPYSFPYSQAQAEVQHEHIQAVPQLGCTVLHLQTPIAVFQVSCTSHVCVWYDGTVTFEVGGEHMLG